MTAVINGMPDRVAAVPESVCAPPAKKLPSASSSEDRMLSLLGRKKTLKELKNTKLVIRRLPQNITMDELTQFLDPIPDHTYIYIARGDCEFSREETLFARAYVNLSRQEDAFSFCKKLDGFPFKSAGRIYRPVFEYAPFHRVPKRVPTKTDNKEGTIESDPDFNAFIESLHEVAYPVYSYYLLLLYLSHVLRPRLRTKASTRSGETRPRPRPSSSTSSRSTSTTTGVPGPTRSLRSSRSGAAPAERRLAMARRVSLARLAYST